MGSITYLDHAATSYPIKYFAKDFPVYGNANSPHSLGIQANQVLEEARNRIKEGLGVESGKVLVGGTASQLVDNLMWRIYSIGNYNILGSVYEHDCFNRWLDYRLTEYPTDQISENDIVCWMMANNITGTIFPVEQIGKMCRNAGAYYIMDAVATVGHYTINNKLESFCDCLITSAHKYGGPQGTGCMWVSDRFAKFLGLSDNSHEEYNLIHGTPNVSAAVAMSYAMENAIGHAEDNNKRYLKLTLHLFDKLINEHNITAALVGQDQPKTHAINAVYLPGFNADALTIFLSSHGIYISPGHSACSSNAADATRVLEAFGLTKEQASQTIRVSFGLNTSQEDIDALVSGIVEFKNLFI